MSVLLNKVGFTVTFNVAKLSQPVTALVKVAVCDSVVVNVIPFQSKGTSVSHTVVSVVLSNVGLTVTFNVAKLSQPVTALVKVAVCDPAAAKFKPFQSNGNSVSHTVVSVALSKVGFIVTFNVAKLSQPVTALVKVAVCDPAAANVKPFQSNGISVSHTVVSVVLSKVGFTVTFNVAKLSQPDTELTNDTVCDSVVVNVIPFQSNGTSVSHTVVSVLDNNVLFTLKFKVAKLSQPVTALVKVAVCDSAPEKFKPFHVYGS
jgi:heme-binding NEAT domain protein